MLNRSYCRMRCRVIDVAVFEDPAAAEAALGPARARLLAPLDHGLKLHLLLASETRCVIGMRARLEQDGRDEFR